MAGRRLQRLPGTRVEPAPNSEYAPISEMRLIMRDYGRVLLALLNYYHTVTVTALVGIMMQVLEYAISVHCDGSLLTLLNNCLSPLLWQQRPIK